MLEIDVLHILIIGLIFCKLYTGIDGHTQPGQTLGYDSLQLNYSIRTKTMHLKYICTGKANGRMLTTYR